MGPIEKGVISLNCVTVLIHDSGNRKGSVNFSLISRTLWKWAAFGKKYLCIQRCDVRRPPRVRGWLGEPVNNTHFVPNKSFPPFSDIGNNVPDLQFFCRSSTETAGLYRSFDLRLNVMLFQMSTPGLPHSCVAYINWKGHRCRVIKVKMEWRLNMGSIIIRVCQRKF